MARQQGCIFRKGSSWFLKYRDNFLTDGVVQRKQVCTFLAKVSDQYRRPSDVADLVDEKLHGVRAAEKCPQSGTPFVFYVEDVWLPFIQRRSEKASKPSTYAGYLSYWKRYIKPRTKSYLLRDFSVAVVSRLLKDVAHSHKVNTDTVGKVRSILSGIFSYAMGNGDFPGKSAADNPASCALIPEEATAPEQTVAATREEVKAILACLDGKGLLLERAAVALLAYTGVRPGEARGLRWEEWNRKAGHIAVVRAIWHAVEGLPKTEQSVRVVPVTADLRSILLDLWKSQRSPIKGYILARAKGARVNLDNMSKRAIAPTLTEAKIPWHGWYSLRRFHGTLVREKSGSSDTASKALGNSKEVFDAHYLKAKDVLPDVRKAVASGTRGLIG